MTKSSTKTSRKIHFFKVTADSGDNGLFGEKINAIIENLDSKARESVYKGTNTNFEVHKHDADSGFVFGQFFNSRDDEPAIRRSGETIRKKIQLDDDEDINETTHFAYCPKSSFLAVEWNMYGPKVGLITWVINDLYKLIEKRSPKNSYMYLRTGKVYEQVTQFRNVRSVKAALKDPSVIDAIGTEGDLGQVTDQMLNSREERIEITVKSRERGGVLMNMRELKQKYIPNQRSVRVFDVLKVSVEDESGKPVEFDLINDKAVAEVVVARDIENGGIESKSMYNKLKDELTFAVKNYIV